MTKSDLRTGMVVKDSCGYIGVVLRNTATVDGIKWFKDTIDDGYGVNQWQELDKVYSEDLTSKDYTEADDIIAVYQPYDFNDYTTIKVYNEDYLIWERKSEIKEVTIKDIEEKFGCRVKIIE